MMSAGRVRSVSRGGRLVAITRGMTLFGLLGLGGCVTTPSGPEETPVVYRPDPAQVCPPLANALRMASDDFAALRGRSAAGTATLSVWPATVVGGAMQCQLVEMGAGVTNYVCSTDLPGPQSAGNWHAAMVEVLQGCLPERPAWQARTWQDQEDDVTVLQAADGKPPSVAVRTFRNPRVRGSGGWAGVISVANRFLAPGTSP